MCSYGVKFGFLLFVSASFGSQVYDIVRKKLYDTIQVSLGANSSPTYAHYNYPNMVPLILGANVVGVVV